MKKIIVVAGGTGMLGSKIIKELIKQDANVRAIVRNETSADKIDTLEKLGVKVFKVNMKEADEISFACVGASCVVSALSGLRDVIIDTQKVLLDGAILAGVRRFIPSDYSLDFTKFSYGENRNLDLRREFHEYLDRSSILPTTIFNGAFTEMVTKEMPLILYKQKLVLFWGNKDHRLSFTTTDNTAAYTANAAMDDSSPRYLRIAGDQISPAEVKSMMTDLTGEKHRLFRPGGLGLLGVIIKIARTVAPAKDELYPAWQGMQYMKNMADKRAEINHLDNDRYPSIEWTKMKDVVGEFLNVSH